MNVIFLGPPGAGKGTVAARVKEMFHLDHLSTGDMLRAEIKQGTELGKLAKQYIDEGKLVPDEVIIGMVQNKLNQTEAGILFDGFPRTVAQAEALGNIATIDAVIELNCDLSEIIRRICGRRICSACGAVYNIEFLKGDRCEACDGELYIRDDDNEETVKKRFHVYQEETMPLVDYYQNLGILHRVNSNISPEHTKQQIAAVLEGLQA